MARTRKSKAAVITACVVLGAAAHGAPTPSWPTPAVGWHDEMNDVRPWQPLPGINEPDVLTPTRGAMTLRMPPVAPGFPYTYQWGGVTRRATVDLGPFPVLVAFVRRIGDGSYAHLDLEERDIAGRAARTLRTPTLQSRGLIVLDVGRAWGPQTRRIHLRLITGGPLTGAACEYAWVRFVPREDLSRLQAVYR